MENYKSFSNDQKTEFWSEKFSSWEKSGLSQRKYCEQENLSYWSFRTWYYKTKPEASGAKFIRLDTSRQEEKLSSKITIMLTRKIRIEVDLNIPEEALRRIFKASEVLND